MTLHRGRWGEGSKLTPLPQEKTTLEKPSLIKVNNKLLKSFLAVKEGGINPFFKFLNNNTEIEANRTYTKNQISICSLCNILNLLMRNIPKWSDTIQKSCSNSFKIFKMCLTILKYYAFKRL